MPPPPALNPAPETVTCHCDVRIEETAEPQMREIRFLDRPVDKLAKRRPRMKVLRRN
ncbi:DUF2200 family protein [Tabrizicola sp.]|uniref:DUF2200 family protein n=1 Tax=Tabrizicola sp. TaxID=2005166 RepID=UPI003A0FBA7F